MIPGLEPSTDDPRTDDGGSDVTQDEDAQDEDAQDEDAQDEDAQDEDAQDEGLAMLAGRNARLIRRQRAALILAVSCALFAGGGLVASRFVRSPQQQAASVRPPKASLLTAPVQEQVLAQTLITRGTVAAAEQIQVTPSSPSQGATSAVVTAVRAKIGQNVKAGQVLLEVSGRPVIALPGAVPAYRDLKPGDEGKDVTELQHALAALGYYSADPSGTFDWNTKQAVTALYQHLGYDVPTTGGAGDTTDRQALQAAQAAVDQARRAVDDMKRQIVAAAAQPSSSTSRKPPSGQEPLSVQLSYLQQALDQAIDNQNQLIATTGPELPGAEFVFVPSFPARVQTIDAAIGHLVTGSLLTLSTGRLQVSAQLQPDQAGLVKQGTSVMITSEALGQQVPGRLHRIGQVTTQGTGSASGGEPATSTNPSGTQPGGTTAVAPYVPITITPAKSLSSAWDGQDVRLTFTQARTAKPVLVVPISAITTGADGSTTITTVAGTTTSRIRVRAGVSADGFVQVAPLDGHPLTASDRVVIGQQ
jgi:peptidoglycan hydrolase-like protein with peptidoglycan-binding domain